jgi:hypothetical protein
MVEAIIPEHLNLLWHEFCRRRQFVASGARRVAWHVAPL